MKKKWLSGVFATILSLFLAVTLLTGGLGVYASRTLCDRTLTQRAVTQSGFSRELYEEIAYKWENLLAVTGVMEPESVMAVLTPEGVEADVLAYIMDGYDGSSDLDTDGLKTALTEKVREYAYSHNIHATPTAELDKNISDLVKACISEYRLSVQIRALPKALGAVSAKEHWLQPVMIAAAVGSAVFLVFLFFLQRKLRNFFYFTALSAATNALVFLGVYGVAMYNRVLERLPFEESALKTMVVWYLEKLLRAVRMLGDGFLLATAVLLLGSVLCWLIGRIKDKKKLPPEPVEEQIEESVEE